MFDITINPDGSHDSEHSSSASDEEDSSGVEVSPPSVPGSHDEYTEYEVGDEWAHLQYPDEIRSSDSASRPRNSRHNRNTIHSSRSRSGRRSSRRGIEREAFPQRSRRYRSPESPDSVDSAEEFVPTYTRHQPDKRFWSSGAPAGVSGYAHSSSSGPSYNVLPQGGMGHMPFGHSGPSHPPSDQLVRFGPLNPMGRSGQFMNAQGYGYGSHYPPPHSGGMPGLFGHDQHPGHPNHLPHHHAQESRNRSRGQSPPEPPLSHMIPSQSNPHYGGPAFAPPDLVPYGGGGYFPYNQNYPGGPVSHHLFGQLPQKPESPSATSQSDIAKDEAIARLEKLILDERAEREARDAAREAAMAKAAADKLAAEERAIAEKKIADEAAAKATAAANAEAEKKAAEEAVKALKLAEEMAAAAAADAKKTAEEAAAVAAAEAKKVADEAAAAAAAEAKKAAEEAAANKPPPEKKKPIKFKDAVGRKFNFPFHLCSTWQGMEELIRQAFLHVEVIGPHVAEGHYDLVGPSGDIILPQVWETVIEPDWTVTMHMWPIPEKPKDDQPPPPPDNNAIIVVEEAKKKPDATAPGPKKPRPGNPGSFAKWMMGNNRNKPNKPLKAPKKPEPVP
ncbi:hypothetical protein BGW36DRAFT_142374 [Talaromyces proteolyticus]|uniref:Ubiquitin-like domain-containing protein n=1 Tax=Talaromyces proteolyticus TaxID=1131652 RepID=A0AAD4KS65_9EURO|nr:uncharacterized protein BGW36DRAFT_142374 [Talaromyces proteolyticus]KAH8698251.1 hypothetical protein BGW36DRAFT_142374 [Talaromyces proteolyticus]